MCAVHASDPEGRDIYPGPYLQNLCDIISLTCSPFEWSNPAFWEMPNVSFCRLRDILENFSPLLRLFAPDSQEVYLLRIMAVSAFRFRNLSRKQTQSLLRIGRAYLNEVAVEITEAFAPLPFYLDTRVVVSDDWPQEILMHANHLKVRMVLMGASERTLPARFLYYENALEQILIQTPCDVGIYRSL